MEKSAKLVVPNNIDQVDLTLRRLQGTFHANKTKSLEYRERVLRSFKKGLVEMKATF